MTRTRIRPHRIALALVLAFSALLECYRLGQNSWANAYYSAAVKSMLVSLHNFFFVSSDPGGPGQRRQAAARAVAADGERGDLRLPARSACSCPEALCAIAAVGVLYLIVAPRFGAWAGVAAAAALAIFPSFVASGRDNNLDALLILLMALACLSRTAWRSRRGSWRWLALDRAAGRAGVQHQDAAPPTWCCRGSRPRGCCVRPAPCAGAWLLAGATALLAAVSFVWVLAVELTPASQRPYVGGSLDNSELSLSFGHNGFGRVLGERGAPVQTIIVKQAKGSLRQAGSISSTGKPGPTRLFDRARRRPGRRGCCRSRCSRCSRSAICCAAGIGATRVSRSYSCSAAGSSSRSWC